VIRTKHFAFDWGYDISTDLLYGFTLALWRRVPRFKRDYVYRLVWRVSFEWPRLVWRDADWMLDEEGYVKGLPLARPGYPAHAWTGRRYTLHSISWPHNFEFTVSK
jgi:hypothetical protein